MVEIRQRKTVRLFLENPFRNSDTSENVRAVLTVKGTLRSYPPPCRIGADQFIHRVHLPHSSAWL